MTTFCEHCIHCEQPSQSSPWYRYTCLLAKKPVPRQYVVEDPWLTESPHYPCYKVNENGDCPDFEQKRETEDV